MKVIIVEVTRAANSFGRTHLDKIREAYERIAEIVEAGPRRRRLQAGHLLRVRGHVLLRGDRAAPLRLDLRPPAADRGEFEHAKSLVVEAICGGLARPGCRPPCLVESPPMENDLVKRLIWSGLLAGVGALASLVAHRVATAVWIRVFDEEPPDD